jgi:hypothetical protein
MTTRTIVTSQPDVECDVCARRLLRGEQPDVFVGAGRRRIVCELCAPRAAHEGWKRESELQALSLPTMRPRRGRSLLGRLPFKIRPSVAASGGPPALTMPTGEDDDAPYDRLAGEDAAPAYTEQHVLPPLADGLHSGHGIAGIDAPVSYEAQTTAHELVATASHEAGHTLLAGHDHLDDDDDAAAAGAGEARSETAPASAQTSPYLHEALAVFNVSEFPRRVAGVARSLGAPAVSVRSAEHLESVVRIVVAWELCWYRYEVDLSEPLPEAQVIAQGTELSEIEREERVENAYAHESGALALHDA